MLEIMCTKSPLPVLDVPRDVPVPVGALYAGAGPEAGGGPPQQETCTFVSTHPSDSPGAPTIYKSDFFDDSPSSPPAEKIFENFACEPYEIVFADPPPCFCSPPLELRSPHVASTDANQGNAMSLVDQHLTVHNLDTGEVRRLGEGALTLSFHGKYASLQQRIDVGGTGSEALVPWASWWAEKRHKDECLWLAAESGSLDQLREALQSRADGSPPAEVNSRSLYGRTALHIATSVGKPESIELLLDGGAELEARTDAGLTALHIASQRGHFSAAVLLLDWGAEALCEANDFSLPIHLAAANGHTNIITLLFDRGGNQYEQLVSRNSLGQRAAEMSLDIATAEIFRQFEGRLSTHSCQSGERSPALDHYAGRTPYNEGSVLLHNARSDVVHRLLHKTQHPPESQGTSAGELLASPDLQDFVRPAARRKSKASVAPMRPPFARVRADNSGMEKVGPDSFELMERLGKGSFGEVFQVKHKRTGEVYAMKILRKNKVMNGNLLRYTVTERNVLSYIHHPYIVSLHFAFQTRSHLVLVLQFGSGGNLQQLIEREKKVPEALAQLYTAEVLLALDHLHRRSIVFRDLKPDNIVIDEDGHALLTDFGLSKEGVVHLQGARSFCGSVAFLAPEILRRCGHGHTVDIYGLGVLLFDMLTGFPPFYHPDRQTLCNNIEHARLQVPHYVSRPAKSLIESLMEREPSKRLGAVNTSDVKRHPYFLGVEFDALMSREVPVPASRLSLVPLDASGHALSRPPNPFKTNQSESKRHGSSQKVSGWSFVGAVK